jgi:choline dehydrogenase-like flavoprotein
MFLANNYTLPSSQWLSYSIASHQEYANAQLKLYYQNRTGAFTRPYEGGGDVAFLPLQNVTGDYKIIIKDAVAKDLQTTIPSGADDTVLQGQKAQQEILLRYFASSDTGIMESILDSGALAILVNLKPLSRGSILIASSSPYTDPVIDFGTFMHSTDLKILIAAYKKTQELLTTPPFAEIGVTQVVNARSDEEIEIELRNGTYSSWQHPVGTLAMMPRKLGGVVDPRLCVYGVKGLRVVDASIMPIIPASHTSSTVYAVAEKVCCPSHTGSSITDCH